METVQFTYHAIRLLMLEVVFFLEILSSMQEEINKFTTVY